MHCIIKLYYHEMTNFIELWVGNYLSLRVITISIMSVIACDFNDLERFDQSLEAILKNG